mgnify:CR=1 FL=1
MNVFLSWSGERSKRIAQLLDEWLQCVIQRIKPWMSSKDIDRGTIWFTEINDQLKTTSTGIICLTRENLNKPWILFEAGALLKGLSSSRLCTLLIDLQPADISDPLAQFNHTLPSKEGMWGLIRSLNNSLLEDRISENILEKIFETYWQQFDGAFKKIMDETEAGDLPKKKDKDELMYELLNSVRMLDKRIRNVEYSNSSLYNEKNYIKDRLENIVIEIIKENNLDFKKMSIDDIVEYVMNRLTNTNNKFDLDFIGRNKSDYMDLYKIIKMYISKYNKFA